MSENTKNYYLRKDAPEDFYDVGVVNANLDKIDRALKEIDTEARNKDGGNADTVDGYHASEFTKYREFDSLDELAETQYEGLFYIGGSEEITGISLKSGRDMDIQPDNTDFLEIYTRIYSDKDGKMYAAADVYSTEYDFWTRKSLKTFSFDGHLHSVSDIEDFPVSLPASGGNADTVGGKQASDFALKNHSHNNFSAWDSDLDSDTSWGVSISASGINFQWNDDINDSELHISENGLMGGGSFLPAVSNFGNISAESFSGNGSNLTSVNADTISGIGIDGIQTKQTGTSSRTDWNDIVEPGFHKLMERGTENAPDNSDWFFPIVFAYSSSGITQLAAAYRYDWIYMRHKKTLENGTIGWTEWRKIGGVFEQTVKTDGTDLNTLHGSTELYNLQGDFINGPDGVGLWGSLLSLYGTGSIKTIQVYFPDAGNGAYIRRCKVNGSSWSEWVNIGGEAVESIRKSTKTFTASAGNWYRLVKGKPHNGSDNSGACGIMTITADSAEYYSGDVISVVQNGSSGSFTILNHSKHNGFFNSYRMVRGNDGYMYIDGYTNLNGGLTSLTFTFSGVGWNIRDYIAVIGSNFGSVVMEAAV